MKHWHDECAVIGIWNHHDAAKLAYLSLYAMQHRGQESTGIVALNERDHITHKGIGLVADVYTAEVLDRLHGNAAIGHVRYSTTGQNNVANIQPLTAELAHGPVAIAHNGNIVNSNELRKELVARGAIFQGTNDTECLLHLVARHPSRNIVRALQDSVERLEGAYSMVVETDRQLVAVRDPHGFRPLVLGKMDNEKGGEAFIVASETCAFDLIGATYVREIEPGEMLIIDKNGMKEVPLFEKQESHQCVFEHIYFSRPDSIVFGQSVHEVRKRLGQRLAQENEVEADVVIPVPDSGIPAAIGYANESGIPFDLGIIRNHYVGRTFIQPQQSIRSFGVKIKLNPQSAVLKDKRVVVIDDSIVRGTTSRKIISLIRQAGAREVHMRIACPPTTDPCYYGVDTPEKGQLIAAKQSLDEICKYIEADSLAYLSIDGMLEAVGNAKNSGYCKACFDGQYPTDLYSQ